MQLQEIAQGRECYVLSNAPALSIDTQKSNDKRAVARGIAISLDYNTKNFRFSRASVLSLRPQAIRTEDSNGVPMHILHMTFWELPVGRTLTASFKRDSELEVEFYLSRDVPQPHTNSIIDRIDDKTIDSVSLGWGLIAQGKRPSYFKCDVCGEKMDRGWFMPYDSNYHYPGKKLKEDGKEIIVTATVHGDIKFRELSIVGGGADPRAKILGDTEVMDTLKTELHQLHIQPADFPTIAELAGWNETLFTDTLSLGIYNPAIPVPADIDKQFSGWRADEREGFRSSGNGSAHRQSEVGNQQRYTGSPLGEQDTSLVSENEQNPRQPASLGGLNTMSEPTGTPPEASQAALEWKPKYEVAAAKITELEAQLESVVTLEDHNQQVETLTTELTETKADLKTAQAEIEKQKHLAIIGENALRAQRKRTENAFLTLRGNKISSPEDAATLKKIQESTDMKWLMEEGDEYWDLVGDHQKRSNYQEADKRTQGDFLPDIESSHFSV